MFLLKHNNEYDEEPQTGLKAAVISAFLSGDWDHFLKESTKYKALTNSNSLTQEETSHERIKCQSLAGKRKWFPVHVECC